MFIEQPPFLYRALFPGTIWRINPDEKSVYLTFDDGPIPEITEWVLDLLDKYEVKATFFCVGDNVRKYPRIYDEILRRGHATGNHTFNHIQGIRTRTNYFLENTEKAAGLIKSNLFRPPHGHMRNRQAYRLRNEYKIVMWDVVTRDYNPKMTGEKVFATVKKYVRKGSIIVFHDSVKSEKNMKWALPKTIEWLKSEGYALKKIEL